MFKKLDEKIKTFNSKKKSLREPFRQLLQRIKTISPNQSPEVSILWNLNFSTLPTNLDPSKETSLLNFCLGDVSKDPQNGGLIYFNFPLSLPTRCRCQYASKWSLSMLWTCKINKRVFSGLVSRLMVQHLFVNTKLSQLDKTYLQIYLFPVPKSGISKKYTNPVRIPKLGFPDFLATWKLWENFVQEQKIVITKTLQKKISEPWSE